MKRVFLIVLDSVGIGEMPDAANYKDEGSNTLRACFNTGNLDIPFMKKLGIFNINGIDYCHGVENPKASFARMKERSKGKDTTTGHWEISGITSEKPMPTFPNGFPNEIIEKFEKATGRKVLCNKPYSGTKVIEDYGKESIETGSLIVYTSADSVFQIAAHEDYVPIEELYNYCETAREILKGDYAVGRVIARPFVGEYPNYKRTANRHDFSLKPPSSTMLDRMKDNKLSVIAVGKINDIFAGQGITEAIRTVGNIDGMNKTIDISKRNFEGLCFVNLVDFDMLYGHRNDVEGYTKALNEFDKQLKLLSENLKEEDIVIITADHGCDPTTDSTDHSREYTPMIVFGDKVKEGINLGTRNSFSDIADTILEYFGLGKDVYAESYLGDILE